MIRSAATLFLAAAVAAPLGAQERVRIRAPERSFTFVIEDDSGVIRMTDSRRGRIGISVALTPDRSRDSIGARVEMVAENGPAERAGIRAGDLIVRWNGERLAEGRGGSDEFRSRPAQRLLNLAQRLEPGDTVRLEVRRDRATQQYSVVADSADMDRIVERLRMPMAGPREFRGPGDHLLPFSEDRLRVFAFGGSALADLELVKVTPQLAEGLGIAEGLLVVDIDSGSALGLRAGDVIVSIGTRRPGTPAQALRILSTYEPEEAVTFEVMRQRRRQTVNGRMPEARRGWRVSPNSFERHEMMPMMRMFEPRVRVIGT